MAKSGLPNSTKAVNSESDVKIWIIKNQFGRRNINAATRAMLALELEPLIREKAREKQVAAGGDKSKALLPNSVKAVNTQKEVAKIAGLGHTTIYEAKKVKESDNEEVAKSLQNSVTNTTKVRHPE